MADQKHKRTSPGAVRLRIEALLDPRKTAIEIAAAANSSPDYVNDVARIHGVKLHVEHRENQINGVWNEQNVELLRKLWIDEGMSAGRIAPILGFTRNAVISKINRKGWLGRRVSPSKIKRVANPLGRRAHKKTTPSVSRPERPQFTADYVPPPPSEYDVPRKRLADLEAEDCRFPVDLPNGKGFGFCALERAPGVSYCPEHARRCLNPVPTRASQKVPANDQREKVGA